MYKILLSFVLLLSVACTNAGTSSGKFRDKEEYYILRGMNNSQEGKYLEAIKELQAAYRKNPKNLVTLRELAYCYGELGDLEEAKKLYGEVLKIEPKDLTSLKNLAYINYVQKNISASKQYLTIIPEKLKDSYTYMLYGLIYMEEKNYKGAYENLKMSVKLNQGFNKELIQKYVELLEKQKKNSEMYAFLEQNYKLYGERKDYVILYSEILSENFNELSKAERILKRYLAEHNNDDDIILELAKNQLEQKKYKETLQVLTLVSSKNSYDSRYLEYKYIAEEKTKTKK